MSDEEKTTTWGDCPNPDCMFYGRMRYGIEPGDLCEEASSDDHGCGSMLRWWDRWHDGKHRRDQFTECAHERRQVIA